MRTHPHPVFRDQSVLSRTLHIEPKRIHIHWGCFMNYRDQLNAPPVRTIFSPAEPSPDEGNILRAALIVFRKNYEQNQQKDEDDEDPIAKIFDQAGSPLILPIFFARRARSCQAKSGPPEGQLHTNHAILPGALTGCLARFRRRKRPFVPNRPFFTPAPHWNAVCV